MFITGISAISYSILYLLNNLFYFRFLLRQGLTFIVNQLLECGNIYLIRYLDLTTYKNKSIDEIVIIVCIVLYQPFPEFSGFITACRTGDFLGDHRFLWVLSFFYSYFYGLLIALFILFPILTTFKIKHCYCTWDMLSTLSIFTKPTHEI